MNCVRCLIVTFVTLTFLNPCLRAQSGPIVWVASSLERVGPTDPSGSGSTATLSAARAEYESFQIVVRASSTALSNVDVSFSDLLGPNGQTIPKSVFTPYRENYVYVSKPSPDWGGTNRPRGAGWYPDGLVPFNDPVTGVALSGAALDAAPFSVAAGKNQPIWVDLLVPSDAPAGQYSGSFTVTSSQGSVTGQISLRVWNFTLPVKPTLRSSVLLWTQNTEAAYTELLKNKLEPLRADPALQRSLIDRYGLAGVGLPFWSGADIGTCTMSSAPTASQFQASANLQQPDLAKYVYSADEIDSCPNLFDTMKQWARNMHQAGVNNLVTMSPTPGLYDDGSGTGRSAVDYWVLLPAMYDRSRVNVGEVLAKGDRVWSYNTLVQDAYSPKWLIDFSPLDFRIQPGFINQSLGLTGILYWRADLWSADPWNVVNAYGGGNYPGEGMLLYPGAQVGTAGPAPSMRLKWLRDGVEDYEYVAMLKKMGRSDWALGVARTVGADWTAWTRDPAQLQSARQQLGAEIDRLAAPPPPPPPPAPSAPVNPSPAGGATGVSKNITLSWSAAANATSYDVYLGTTSAPVRVGTTSGTSYPLANLPASTIHYWKVVSSNSSGTASSTTWSFTTAADTPVNVPPVAVSITPPTGYGSSATYTLVYSDANGAADLTSYGVLINTSVTGVAACWISIDGTSVWLADDNGVGWTSRALTDSKPLSNSQCSLTPRNIQITKSLTQLTVTLPLTFKSSFAGIRNFYSNAVDRAGATSGYQAKATRTIR